MKTSKTITTYSCDICGDTSDDEDYYFSGENSFVSLCCSNGDRDVGPSYINLKYAGCSIPYSSSAPKDVCKHCMIKFMKKWIDENDGE